MLHIDSTKMKLVNGIRFILPVTIIITTYCFSVLTLTVARVGLKASRKLYV